MKNIFEDSFHVVNIKSGQFDRVKRMQCKGDIYDVQVELDVNVEVYDMKPGVVIEV